MKLLFDLHTHTIMSGHAYSTLRENIEEAKEKGLKAYGFAEHSVALPGSVHEIYFQNFKVIPKEVNGVEIYCGIELNILDLEGNVDSNKFIHDHMDYMIASQHSNVLIPGSSFENTKCLLKVMEDEKIKIIGHPDDIRYNLDYDILAKEAKNTKTVLELNNSSLSPYSYRVGAEETVGKMLSACMKYETKIIVNSDAHFYSDVGNFDRALKILEKYEFPEELVVNSSMEGLKYVLNDSPRLNMFK